MKTKELEKNIKTIIKTGAGYGAEFLPVLKDTKNILKRINKGRPTAENYFQLGQRLLELEDNQLAMDAFEEGYKLDDKHVYCATYYALLLEQFDKINEALAVYLQLNKSNPENIQIAERMLAIYESQTDLKSTLLLCQYFLGRGLRYHIIHLYLAKAYTSLYNYAGATKHLETAISLQDEEQANKSINLLVLNYIKSKNYKKILAIKESIFTIPEATLKTKLHYATACAEVENFSEARSVYCSLYSEYNEPVSRYEILSMIAVFHHMYENNDKKAIFINKYILKRDPINPYALTNLSLTESDEFAYNAYKKVYEQNPEAIMMKYNYGYSLLNWLGDFEKGYELFESRIDLRSEVLLPLLNYPETLENKKIFIFKEQGVGDHIWLAWFFQYLGILKNNSKIQIDERLLPLMERSFPSLTFTGKSHKDIIITENLKDDYDGVIMLYSAGKYFIKEIKDAQKDFENGVTRPAYLLVDEDKKIHWQEKLRAFSGKKIVGICWRSGLNTALRNKNYMSVDELIHVLKDINCYIVNLQYKTTEEELEKLSQALGKRFIHLPELDVTNDFDNMAALMKSLDLVFTASTAVHELAGALNINTITFNGLGKNSHRKIFGKNFNFAYPTLKHIGIKNKIPAECTDYFIEEINKSLDHSYSG